MKKTLTKNLQNIIKKMMCVAACLAMVVFSMPTESYAGIFDFLSIEGETYIRVGQVVISEDNNSGDGWEYDYETNTLTLDGFNYEGTGIFCEDSDEEDEYWDEEEDEYWDEEDDEYWDEDDDEYWDEEDDEYWDEEDDECWDEEDDEYWDEEDELAADEIGVIYANKAINVCIIGVNSISVTDEGATPLYAFNVVPEEIFGMGSLAYYFNGEAMSIAANSGISIPGKKTLEPKDKFDDFAGDFEENVEDSFTNEESGIEGIQFEDFDETDSNIIDNGYFSDGDSEVIGSSDIYTGYVDTISNDSGNTGGERIKYVKVYRNLGSDRPTIVYIGKSNKLSHEIVPTKCKPVKGNTVRTITNNPEEKKSHLGINIALSVLILSGLGILLYLYRRRRVSDIEE